MLHGTSECIAENELISWAAGELSHARIVALDRHVDACEHCQVLVGEALRNSGATLHGTRNAATFHDGAIVAERYRIDRFLAHGGMGEVYEATDQWLKHRVALKTLLASIADDATALARLKLEVLTARQVSHPNVCRIFDFGFHTRRPAHRKGKVEQIAFLTMELLQGESLKAKLRRHGPLAQSEAFGIVRQLASGLATAHAAGVIHRDFKPDNVMLVEAEYFERVVITDFGLARSALIASSEPLSSSHHLLGTLDYMAPEQLLGSPATPRSDLFALGVVLYEMLAGRLPFDGETAAARAFARTRKAPTPPSKLNPGITKRWDAAILRCLAIEPSERFSSAEDVVRALQDHPPPRRTRWQVPVALAAVLAAAALGYFGIRSVSRGGGSSGAPQDVEPRPDPRPAAAIPVAPLPNAPATPLLGVTSGRPAAMPARQPRFGSSPTGSASSSSTEPVPQPKPRKPPPRAIPLPARPPAITNQEKPAADGLLDPFVTQ
jgi:serine/threonine protein kinase